MVKPLTIEIRANLGFRILGYRSVRGTEASNGRSEIFGRIASRKSSCLMPTTNRLDADRGGTPAVVCCVLCPMP